MVDVAAQSGIDYHWTIAGKHPYNILQTIGNGCAFLDYNKDGNLDILLIGPNLALYRGNGHGKFTNVSHEAGLSNLHGHFLGCAVGDYDGDGYDDIYISGFQTGLLLKNDRGKRFVDVTTATRLKPQPWGSSCAWTALTPASRRLDLIVGNYVAFVPGSPKYRQLCITKGITTACGPRFYTPLRSVLYRQSPDGTFQDDSASLHLDRTNGRVLGVAVATLDDSGRPTIALADDQTPGDLLSPQKGSRDYKNIGVAAGTAFDRDGNIHAGMGTDWGDFDNDGRLDMVLGTFQGETKSLYHNDGNNLYTDVSYQANLAPPTIPNITFGCKFVDVDNDGWLDIMMTNGHIEDNIHDIDAGFQYKQPTQLFRNNGQSPVTFDDLSGSSEDLKRPILGRGLATGDFDNDGRVDALVVDSEGAPLLLHNETANAGHWLEIVLEGTRSNTDGYGAVVTLTAAGHTYVRQCQTAGSYLSASDKRVHFGLSSATVADALSVHWPDGHIDTVKNVQVSQIIALKEGAGIIKKTD